MENIFIKLFKKSSIENIGIILFLSGIFFLPSTLLFGVSFLLPAAIMGSFLQQKSFFKDKWNYPFLIFGLLILISSLLQNFILTNPYYEIWDPKLSLIGLGNWLPFLWLFWGFQPYLNTRLKREKFALFLTAGTLPVFVTGFGQYFFNWHGPFETLNGLIIWYQRPIDDPGGLSGLFNNQNYTGSWLNFVWPFSLALFLDKSNIASPTLLRNRLNKAYTSDINKLLKSQKDGKITPGQYVEEYFNLKTRYEKFLLEIDIYAKDVENIVGKSLKYNLYKKFKQKIPKSLEQSNKEINEFIKESFSSDNPLYEILNKGKSKVQLDVKPMSNDIAMLNTDTRDRETIVIITDSIA